MTFFTVEQAVRCAYLCAEVGDIPCWEVIEDCAPCEECAASVDTLPKGEDAKQASCGSKGSAVGESRDAPNLRSILMNTPIILPDKGCAISLCEPSLSSFGSSRCASRRFPLQSTIARLAA